MISFNVAPFTEKVFDYIRDTIEQKKICGDGKYTGLCNKWLEEKTGSEKAMLTTSCTHALEMSAILLDIKPGDEVIMPSYTFVSTANAFVLRGAKIVFVDIRPDTMNIDEALIEDAVTDKTRAIVPVHYAGVSCEMDVIKDIAGRHNIAVVEDAAQGLMSEYKGKALGAIGDIGCYSFHETKNYSMGEGGAVLVNRKELVERAEIIREKGTDRSKFFRGQVDKYTWCDIGSSYLPSDILAAYLWAQFELSEEIFSKRMDVWNRYNKMFKTLADKEYIELPYIPEECSHNAHMFYIKTKDNDTRNKLISYLKNREINAVFHYIPLHTSPAGLQHGRFFGEDRYTTVESGRLLRLPLFYGIKDEEVDKVIEAVYQFYE